MAGTIDPMPPTPSSPRWSAVLALFLLVAVSGCATTPPPRSCEDVWERPDPFSFWNRPVHKVNTWTDRKVFDPLIDVWLYVPSVVRNRFTDFARNLRAPRNFANNLLQADWKGAGTETMRFALNTTIGIGGLFDVAKPLTGVKSDPEDFGQTLALWGVPAGPLLYIPFRGPQTLREFGGGFADDAFSVTTFAPSGASIPLRVMRYGNRAQRRAKLDEVLDEVYELDFEDSYRESQCVYFKQRIYRIIDGKLPKKIELKEDLEPPSEPIHIPEALKEDIE